MKTNTTPTITSTLKKINLPKIISKTTIDNPYVSIKTKGFGKFKRTVINVKNGKKGSAPLAKFSFGNI